MKQSPSEKNKEEQSIYIICEGLWRGRKEDEEGEWGRIYK